ncbi:pentapeptide repeat-containing protein [Thalassospira australica]|uniref:pentapeptide repeat-containing protein n=1 Tax=Thalassospira australica TaxID=1528106 RepID=UPI00068C3A6E|nr:pentapeptide repeat-containing protein [Thalassospira australica]
MASHDNKKKTILYADYSERNTNAAREAVKPLGFGSFVHCDDRERTIAMIADLKPDIVLIGLYLDGMRGISTIKGIRESATDANPFGRNVPILLGAPKLDRRGMRDAVNAGIEGVFRQPVDPKRLTKIIEMVLKKPRRFVLEENYFGPARPQDLAKMTPQEARIAGGAQDATPTPEKIEPEKTEANASVTLSDPSTVVPAATTFETVKQPAATKTKSVASRKPTANLDLADTRPRLNGAGQTFDDNELVGAPSTKDKRTGAQNIAAVQSAREVLGPSSAVQATENDETATAETEPQEDVTVDEEELVEIDLQEALVGHKLWVDTGGKEGAVMSIEHADLRDAELEGIDLSRCGLPFASFQRANCKNAVLRRCNLVAADFVESNLDNANLAASRLSGARFNKAVIRNTVFLGSDLSNANFSGLRMVNCDLSGTNLAGTDFRDTDLSGTRGLFAEQIQRARVNANTRLPRNIKLRD